MKFRLPDISTDTIKKGFEHFRSETIPDALSKARSAVSGTDMAYDRFFREELEADEEELAAQRAHAFAYAPLFSILVPVYMTPELFLRAMLESVIAQTYGNWELCIVDGSQAKGEPPLLDVRLTEDGEQTVLEKVYSLETERIIHQYMEKEPRIRYQKMAENKGISGNSNAALAMAHGEYVLLLDHDDVLTEDALFRVAEALQEQRYDALYSDEDRMAETGERYMEPRFKPDFDIELLRTCNYIAHLFAARRELLLAEGGFQSRFDGAQGYDRILRCCEGNRQVRHIARVLYHKRVHAGSSPEREAKHQQENIAGWEVVSAHIERQHLLARVSRTKRRGVYDIKYDTPGNPTVSVIVTGHTNAELAKRLLPLFFEKLRYSDFEIVLVDSDSAEGDLQKYYQEIQSRRRNIRVVSVGDEKNPAMWKNLGAVKASGTYFLFLDANIGVADATSLGEMLGICMQPQVGIVSGSLYDERDLFCPSGVEFTGKRETVVQRWQREVQHEVDLQNIRDLYRLPYRGLHRPEEKDETWRTSHGDWSGTKQFFHMNRSYPAVLPNCMLVDRALFVKLGGFSDKFETELSALDFCLRAHEYGSSVVQAAHAVWRTHDLPESVRLLRDHEPEDAAGERAERDLFEALWL